MNDDQTSSEELVVNTKDFKVLVNTEEFIRLRDKLDEVTNEVQRLRSMVSTCQQDGVASVSVGNVNLGFNIDDPDMESGKKEIITILDQE